MKSPDHKKWLERKKYESEDGFNTLWALAIVVFFLMFLGMFVGAKMGKDEGKLECSQIKFPTYYSHSFRIPEDVKPGTYHVELELYK